WGRAMASVPNSRLILHCPAGSHRQHVRDKLGEHDVAPERIEFASHRPRFDFYKLFRRIDICLDTVPCNGGATRRESFWMGVPVITRMGRTVIGRGGFSVLSNLGLSELAAQSDDEFVSIVTALANDLPRLADLRRTMRERLEQSPIMDARKFARDIENAYR